jgi:hypothetical protein
MGSVAGSGLFFGTWIAYLRRPPSAAALAPVDARSMRGRLFDAASRTML